MSALLLDIGGSWMRLGSGARDARPLRVSTPVNLSDAKAALNTLIAQARKSALFSSTSEVVVSIGGLVDRNGTVQRSIYTPFAGINMRALLGELGLSAVHVENDAKFQLRGLPRLGITVLVSAGTGIGGAAGIAGKPFADAHAFGGEFGHAFFTGIDELCPCGAKGCLDLVLGGRAIERRLGPDWHFGEASSETSEYVTVIAHHIGMLTTSLLRVYDPHAIYFSGHLFANRAIRVAACRSVEHHWTRARCGFVPETWAIATKALSRVARLQRQEKLVA